MAGPGRAQRPERWVIDSSVIVKWFNPEEQDHQLAIAVRDSHINELTMGVIPDLAMYEVVNALRHNSQYDAQEVAAAVAEMGTLGLDIVPFQLDILLRASELAFDMGATVYDCYFAALAEHLDVPLVTADEKMMRQLRDHPWMLPLRTAVRGFDQ